MFTFKGKSVNVVDVGRQLKADFVIEGSVRRIGSRVRATVQLIDAETGAHTFAEKFDREIADIFEVQDQIVTLVIGRLSFGLDEAAAAQRTRGRSNNASAYTLFLKARAAWRIDDEENAVKYLEEAVAIDPNYARALGYLAFFKSLAAATSNTAEDFENLRRTAEEYAERALKTGKGDPYTLQRAAIAYLHIGKPKLARSYIDAAALDSPRDLEITHVRGLVLALNGLHEEGRELVEQSIRADPRAPPAYYGTLAEMRFLCGDYLGAIEVIDRMPHLPDWVSVVKAFCLTKLGRHDEAKETIRHLKIDWEQYQRNWAVMCLREETAKLFRDAFDELLSQQG
jgi:tetratricopeptide (TPR) repeat protein